MDDALGINVTFNEPQFPWPFALVLGLSFIGGAIYLLAYTLKRNNYLILVGIFGGFLPFFVGGFLIICGFLVSPPSIFRYTVPHFPLPWIN